MMTKTWLLWIVGLTFSAAVFADCPIKEISKKYPKLKSLFEMNAKLEKAGAAADAKFDGLLDQAKSFEDAVTRQLSDIQEIGCGKLDEKAKSQFESCLNLVSYSCEALPPSLWLDFVAKVKRSREQELAFQLQAGDKRKIETFLYKPMNFFDVCCGDFGCATNGVGLPSMIYNQQAMEALVELASIKGRYGNIALKTVEMSYAALQKGSCSCHVPEAADFDSVIKNLKAAQRKIALESSRQRQLNSVWDQMIAKLSKGLPKTDCKLPGY